MSRNIISGKERISGKEIQTERLEDPYVSKLIKLIPAEIVGVYLAVFNLLQLQQPENGNPKPLELIIFGVMLIITPIYLKKVAHIKGVRQIGFCTVSFVVWAFSIGGPVEELKVWGYSTQFLASVFLPIYTLLIPLIYDSTPHKQPQ